MAQPIQTPIPGQLLRNEFGLRGRVELQLGNEIIPTVSISDLARGAGLPLRRLVTSRWYQTGVVGEYFVFQLVSPPNVLVRLDRLYIDVEAGGTLKIHHGNAFAVAPANLCDVRFTDGRLLIPDFVNPACFPTYDTQAADLGADQEFRFVVKTASESQVVDLSHIVVGAADASSYGYFEMSFTPANTAVAGSLLWQEFPVG